MKKILFVSTHYPSRLGGVRRLYYHLEHFSRNFEVHFIRVRVDGSPDRAVMGLPEGVLFSEIAARVPFPDPLSLLFPASCLRMMKIRSALRQVQSYADSRGIGCVVVHAFDATLALRGLRARLKVGEVLDSMQAYYDSKHAAGKSPYSSAMSLLMGAAYPAVSGELASRYDLLAFVSETDRHCPETKNSLSLPDVRDPPAAGKNLGKRTDGVALFGRWMHPPNRDGLARIAGELGGIRGGVLLLGPGLDSGRVWPGNVRVAGFVENVDEVLSNCKVCLIPVWYGAGLQNKVFDALRCGCIVVTTPFTKSTFESNGFSSPSIVSAEDLVKAANRALSGWSASDARDAYAAYDAFRKITLEKEAGYARKINALLEGRK